MSVYIRCCRDMYRLKGLRHAVDNTAEICARAEWWVLIVREFDPARLGLDSFPDIKELAGRREERNRVELGAMHAYHIVNRGIVCASHPVNAVDQD